MGDPKKTRKKYTTPRHPWQRARIESEKILLREYGLKNKREIWKMTSRLKNYADQAKIYVALDTPQSEKQKQALLVKLKRLGILSQNGTVVDILGLEPKAIMERRLQTLVYRKGMARTISQARQFVKHEHVVVGTRTVSVPSYIVPLDEEPSIVFVTNSSLFSADHPERVIIEKKVKKHETTKK